MTELIIDTLLELNFFADFWNSLTKSQQKLIKQDIENCFVRLLK